MEEMIHGRGFILGALGTETQTQGYAIDGVSMFSQFGPPLEQDTVALGDLEGDGFEESNTKVGAGVGAEGDICGDDKKKGTSQRTAGYNDKEDIMLCHSWLFISQDPICGAEKKGQAYWRKIAQEFHERRQLAPYHIHSTRNQTFLQKR
jgi:hypothetical protein